MVRITRIIQNHIAKDYQGFPKRLGEHAILTQTKFIKRKSPSIFTISEVTPSENWTLHWHGNTPYFHFGTRLFVCHQGHDANNSQKVKYRNGVDTKAMHLKGYKAGNVPGRSGKVLPILCKV